jgi:hypothetical protein
MNWRRLTSNMGSRVNCVGHPEVDCQLEFVWGVHRTVGGLGRITRAWRIRTWRIRKLRRDRHLEKTVAMVPATCSAQGRLGRAAVGQNVLSEYCP